MSARPLSSAAALVSLADVRQAAGRIRGVARKTPVHVSRSLDERTGATLFFKCESLQRGGSFKLRGAANAVFSLSPEEAARGVATHSSGNHGAALALAARERGIPAFVVLPETAPRVKREAVAGYGARITGCEPTLAAREEGLARVVSETGARVVHPFDDARVIAGQGTAGLELCEEVPDLDLVVVPVGGGGLASGTAVSARGLAPRARVIGVEPERADDARRSLLAGRITPVGDPTTLADGLKATIGPLPFAHFQALGVEVVTVREEEIVEAMRLLWERVKLVVEPSAAVAVAALVFDRVEARGRRVGVILSGGNVDLDRLPWQG